jgi:LuxR family transcriptional regulator, regulator of acetate metabolism
MSTASPSSDVFSGPIGEQLHRRLQEATALARRELGHDTAESAGDGDDLAALRPLIGALAAQSPGDAEAAAEHAAALERLRHRYEGRFEALKEAQVAIGRLREVTAPGTMLARAPRALCEHSALRRAIVSVVRDGRMIAEATYFSGDDRGAREVLEELRDRPVALEHPLIETELLRRRRATIVVDAHVHPRVDRRTAALLRWRSYVAAPLLVGPRVIGVIHADRGPEETVDVLDREVLWEFASGLTQAYESAGLRRSLRHEREQMRQFLEWVGARSGELTGAPITLATRSATQPPAPAALAGPAPAAEGRDDTAVFAGLLTRRELDVLRLLAEGNSNKAIADALVVSGATVKFHMGGILRKLHVANRAEAVSRYLSLLGMRAP